MSEFAGFEGVLQAQAVTFTSSPDRSVFSFLYDNFVVEWLPNDNGGEDGKSGSRSLALGVGPGAPGRIVAVDFSGASYGNLGPDAKLVVTVDSTRVEVPLSRSEDDPNICHRIEAPVGEGEATVRISVEAFVPRPDPAGTQASIQIDALDVSLVPAGKDGAGT